MRGSTTQAGFLILLAGSLLASGCGSGAKVGTTTAAQMNSPAQGSAPKPGLAGTSWRLVEIQSMDDNTGVKRPAGSAQYTMRLKADGSVSMRLNCNSATGKWEAEPGPEATSGRFEFGALAMTRMLCPPPSLDEEIAGQSKWVRSFLLKEGRLYLSLMADGGIFVWEPLQEDAFLSDPDPALEEAILKACPQYTKAAFEGPGALKLSRYAYSRVDLNGDGADEVLVYLMGPFFCGTGGCNLQIFTTTADGYRLMNELPLSRPPVIVSPAKSQGWPDLWKLQTGGGGPSEFVRYRFDGGAYMEGERRPAGQEPEGRRVLAGDLSFEKGAELAPRR